MTTPKTLRVDTAHLTMAGQNFSTAAESIPTAPTPYIPAGADSVSAKIATQSPKVMEPVSTGLPALKAATVKYAETVSQAANIYATTGAQAADDVTRKSQELDQAASRATQAGGSGGSGSGGSGGSGSGSGGSRNTSGSASGNGGAAESPSAATGAGGDGMSQLISMGMQMGGQALQVPMQMAGMASSIPQTVMQTVQQVSQMAGGQNQDDKNAQDKPGDTGAGSSDERHHAAQAKPAEPATQGHDPRSGAGTTATEKAPESHAAPQPPPIHPRTESTPKTPTEVLL